MGIKEILEKAKVNADGTLDESIVAELDAFVSELVDMKVKDKAAQMLKETTEPILAEARETLIKEYEDKFEEFKETVSTSFSEFVDGVLDEELELPEEVVKWAAIGQKYSTLIESLRTQIAVDDGQVDEETKASLAKANEEIESLRDQLNAEISEKFVLKRDTEEMAAHIYLRSKCDGLSESQRMRVMGILKGEKDARVINEKFDFIMKNILDENVAAGVNAPAPTEPEGNPAPLGKEKTSVQQEVEKECVCPSCKKVVATANNVACSMLKCPDCDDTHLTDKTSETAKPEKNGDIGTDIHENFGINESLSATAAKLYAQMLDG